MRGVAGVNTSKEGELEGNETRCCHIIMSMMMRAMMMMVMMMMMMKTMMISCNNNLIGVRGSDRDGQRTTAVNSRSSG